MRCKRCNSEDIREYHGDVISVGHGIGQQVWAACADCGLHVDHDDWLAEREEDEDDDNGL